MKTFSIRLSLLAACLIAADVWAQTTPPASADSNPAATTGRAQDNTGVPSYQKIEPPATRAYDLPDALPRGTTQDPLGVPSYRLGDPLGAPSTGGLPSPGGQLPGTPPSLGEIQDPTPLPDYRRPAGDPSGLPDTDLSTPNWRSRTPAVDPPAATAPAAALAPVPGDPLKRPSTAQPGEQPRDVPFDPNAELQYTPPGAEPEDLPPTAPLGAPTLDRPQPGESSIEPPPRRPFGDPGLTPWPRSEEPDGSAKADTDADKPKRVAVEIRVIRPGSKRLVYNAQVAIFTIGDNPQRIRSGVTGLSGGPFEAERQGQLDPAYGKLLVVAAREDKIGSTVIVYDPELRNWRPEPAYDDSQWDNRQDWRVISGDEPRWPGEGGSTFLADPEPIRVPLDQDRAGAGRAHRAGDSRSCGC